MVCRELNEIRRGGQRDEMGYGRFRTVPSGEGIDPTVWRQSNLDLLVKETLSHNHGSLFDRPKKGKWRTGALAGDDD